MAVFGEEIRGAHQLAIRRRPRWLGQSIPRRSRFPLPVEVTDPMAVAHAGVRIRANAVKAAGSDDARAILQAMDAQTYAAPEGAIRIDPSTNRT